MTQMPEAIATALVAFQANNKGMTLDNGQFQSHVYGRFGQQFGGQFWR
mgnify:CR=1 FL=1